MAYVMQVSNALAQQFPIPDDPSDRRAGERALSIFRVGRIVWDGQDQLCVIRNISPGGVQFECLHLPVVGQELAIEMRSDKRVTGVVRWVRDGKAGMQFDSEINVGRMLSEDGSSLLRVRPRPPRFVRRGAVRLIADGETIPATIVDISISGISCRPELPMRKGQPVVAALDDVGATNAEIRWVQGDVTGVRFAKPLPWKPFMLWLDKAPRA